MAGERDFAGLLKWRCIGPFRGGRVVAVAGDYHNPNVFYFGACAGGVWKTTDAGTYWECVTDGFFNTSSVGALEVAPSDSNVIYAGTGETTIRIDVSHGDGVYKSTDAGATWQHMGLSDTRHIAKIRVHPQNPDIVYVAALGHAFGPNSERGVYKSTDGGQTWKQVLFKSDKAGAIDLSIDPTNPRIIYATIWEAYRNFWQISTGGPDSGIWKSTDGGETWTDISDNPGLPKGIKGKIGIAASPAQAGRVWAIVESKEGGLYRSDNYGMTWEMVSGDQLLVSRAWYYMHVTADPKDADTVYVNNLSFWKSTDGGKTFVEIATPHGDNHDLWIDPNNPLRMIQGNDGGANVSLNGGATWSSVYNQPTAQFYHIATDNRSPYYVYGTQQDNSSVAVPTRSHHGSIAWSDCYVAGTGESGYIAVRPDNPDIVYVGAIGSSPGGGNCLQRYDHRTKQIRLITTWPETVSGHGAEAMRYRFAWTYPIVISPHDPNTIYVGGSVVFKTTNEGQTWEPISPDLTRADPETLKPSGGPINRDAVGAEIYATVFAFAESAHEAGVLWAGSDDGLLHISKDGGQNWTNITPPELPERTLISCIELSPFDKATAYVAGTRYKLDDYQPYLYKTTDYGQSWTRINAGIPDNDFTRVVRADPERQGLLFAGTETGVYVSFDDGAAWERFQINLPITPIHDLLIKENDLIAGTHGRSIWVLDDISPLRQYRDDVRDGATHLFTPRTTVRLMPRVYEGGFGDAPGKNYASGLGVVAAYYERTLPDATKERVFLDSGANPPKGAVITYFLKEEPKQPIKLSFRDAQGNVIRTFTSAEPKAKEQAQETAEAGKGTTEAEQAPQEQLPTSAEGLEGATTEEVVADEKIPAKAGWNRFVWDLRHESVPKVKGNDPVSKATIGGPLVLPGTYGVTLTAGDQTLSQQFEVIQDPVTEASPDDLRAQFELWQQINSKVSETVTAINRTRDLRQQLDGWNERMGKRADGKVLAQAASALKDKVLEIEKALKVPDMRPGWTDERNFGVQLLDQLTSLIDVVAIGDYRPTDQAAAHFTELAGQIDEQIGKLNTLLETDLAALNKQIAEVGVGAVV